MLHYTLKRIGLGLAILATVMFAMYAAVFLVPGNRYHWRHPHGMPPGQARRLMREEHREWKGHGHRD